MEITRALIPLAGITLCGVLLSGCGQIKINPPDPSGTPGPAPTSSSVSTLTVPVAVELKDVAALANAQLQTSEVRSHLQGTYIIYESVPHLHFHGALKKPTVTHDPVNVAHIDWNAAPGNVALAGANDKVSVHVPFSGGGKLIPSAATADASGSVDGSSTLTIAPDYDLTPDVDLTVNIARATLLHAISVKGLVQNGINQAITAEMGGFGKALSDAIDLRKRAETAWAGLPGSFAVPGTKDIWVTLDPQAVLLDGPHASNDAVTARLAIKTEVTTLFQSAQPAAPPRVPLPNISGAPADDNFHLAVPVDIEVDDLNRALAPIVVSNENSPFDLGDGQSVRLKSLLLLPAGNRLYLKMGFEGVSGKWVKNVRGTLIFVAEPILSADGQSLSFDQIDYSEETKSTLKGAAEETATTLLKPVLVHILQQRLVVNLAPELAKAKSAAGTLAGQIKFPPPLALSFDLSDVKPSHLVVYGDQIYCEFDATGTAKLTF